MSSLVNAAKIFTSIIIAIHLFSFLWFRGELAEEVMVAFLIKVAAAVYFLSMSLFSCSIKSSMKKMLSAIVFLIFCGALFLEYTTLSEYILKFGMPTGEILINTIFLAAVTILALAGIKKKIR